MEPSSTGSHGAFRGMLGNTRAWRRCLFFGAILIIFVTLWLTQHNMLKTIPRAAYILARPTVKEVNHAFRDANKPPATTSTEERKRQERPAESSLSSVTLTTSEKYSQELISNAITNISKDEESFMREREKVYRERRERVNEVCRQLGLAGINTAVKHSALKRLFWLMSHRFIMCFNAKVGTSTWASLMLERARPDHKVPQMVHVPAYKFLKPPYKRDSPEALQMMKEFGKIMTVRHPFTRIVSAYVDKMTGTEYEKLRRRIVEKYRTATNSSRSPNIPTFQEFARYLVDVIPLNPHPKEVKFMDRHWKPFYLNCAPCNIDYDLILKLETINEDTMYVSQRYHLGIKEVALKHHKSSNSTNTTLTFFKTLPQHITQALYQRFRVDFLMFNYSVSPYLLT